MASIYDQTYVDMWRDNLPIQYKLRKFLAWGGWLLSPLQWLHDLIFTDYLLGSGAADWVSGNPYIYGDRVRYLDGRVYELTNTAGLTSSTPPSKDPANWFKVLDTWIGVQERSKYTCQKIMLEWILNRHFLVAGVSLPWTGASHTTQIYVANNNNSRTNFWLSNGGVAVGTLTSFMSNGGVAQRFFMGNSYSAYSPYSFTIYVKASIYTAIAATIPAGSADTAETLIRSIADNYVRAGKTYAVVQY